MRVFSDCVPPEHDDTTEPDSHSRRQTVARVLVIAMAYLGLVFKCCKARFSPPPGRLLCGDRCFAATQDIFLDLASGSFGQFSDNRERLRHFEVCHVVANEGT